MRDNAARAAGPMLVLDDSSRSPRMTIGQRRHPAVSWIGRRARLELVRTLDDIKYIILFINKSEPDTMHITIETLPELKLAALGFAGQFSGLGTEMPKMWANFLSREEEFEPLGAVRYGVNLQERGGINIECVARAVADLNAIPNGMIGLRIPGQRYAVFTHRGPMSAVQATYVTAFAAMEQLGLRHDTAGWRLERYDKRFTPSVDSPSRTDNAFEILVPLRN
jgi:predicted transcriptional regulator YdeE